MSKFFINRPIVAIVISIFLVIVGIVAMIRLPIAQFPNIIPPEIQIETTFVGADAETVEQSVATPIEQQMSGVDYMNYMYSLNASNGTLRMFINFDIKTDPNIDHVLSQMRLSQAESQLPQEVRNFGITVRKSILTPLLIFALYSPNSTRDATFLTNYAHINLYDQLLRIPGISNVVIFGSGQFAIRIWLKPDIMAKLGITVPEIIQAVEKQNTINPAGQIGAEPVPTGQEFTYTVRTQSRLVTEEEFGNIVIRATPEGTIVRLRDLARIELGTQVYNIKGMLNGKPSAIIVLYQLPGTNAVSIVKNARALMEEAKKRFPEDINYVVALDTTFAITEGIKETIKTFLEALLLVTLVVYIFLQGWRATLIPILAVPVSLIGTFAIFPFFGFSINTLSLFGLVLAIGLVVDDAIIVVEAVEYHIEQGMHPREAALKTMEEVSGPVVAIALILVAVFIPSIFIPGITGRLYQQFATTIAFSIIISAFNALTLSPALSALLLKPAKTKRVFLSTFFKLFNNLFLKTSKGYLKICQILIHKSIFSIILIAALAFFAVIMGKMLPTGFLPEEDQGYLFLHLSLPDSSSLQRTDETCKKIEEILKKTPGVQYFSVVRGFSLLSNVQNTFSAFSFITLNPWKERKKPEESFENILKYINQELANLPQGIAFAFSPPAIPGIGTAGGVTFVLEDRAGRDTNFLAQNLKKFLEAASKRKELERVTTTALLSVPQIYVDIDRDKVLKLGIDIRHVYQTLQAFMGGYFVNYFNRFGRQWQVYVQAEGKYRTCSEDLNQFYVLNERGDPVPLSTLARVRSFSGPEFTMRFNLYRAAQINVIAREGYSTAQAMKALEEVFKETMPPEMGYDYLGMSFQEKQAQKGVPASLIFGLSVLSVFLILSAQYESWLLPLSVLLCTPVAITGAFAAIWTRGQINNIYAQIAMIVLIGLSAKNSILIVEFAKLRYEQGTPIIEAALEGARLRFRPIIMTSFAFIFGVGPLAFSTGAGALARQIMGTAVIGGTLSASLIAIFLIPSTFYLVEKFLHKKVKNEEKKNNL